MANGMIGIPADSMANHTNTKRLPAHVIAIGFFAQMVRTVDGTKNLLDAND